ncbi:hypothetical protein ACFQJ5_03915 [Halomicroarcula sp. GCM10025324]|jgi:predicted RNA-binding Zn-ribbon protein involved in translation (DUF1610 family)|uniref:hypothetical protein n=1 Tax=Haloarcula TaxID=2237 RepID=UPI0023E8B0C9|nr:hypothetical protein [Halomicroarcula sp. ZS-22-S1]
MLDTKEVSQLTCLECGFEAPAGETWNRVTAPPFGLLTQCPECGSTNIHSHS